MDTNITKLTDEQRVCKIVADHLGVADAKPESTLNELGADSLDLIEITMSLEDDFGIEIPDEDLEKVTTVSDFVSLVARGV